jgi:predicted nucleic acid-binding protein
MAVYLLDCNHLSVALHKVSIVRDRIHQERKKGQRFATCYPVLCELEAGIQQSPKQTEYRRRLGQLLRHVRVWPIDGDTARRYGEAFNQLRQKGRALSQVDIMLAALGRQHKPTILTADRDFEALPDLRVENWII